LTFNFSLLNQKQASSSPVKNATVFEIFQTPKSIHLFVNSSDFCGLKCLRRISGKSMRSPSNHNQGGGGVVSMVVSTLNDLLNMHIRAEIGEALWCTLSPSRPIEKIEY
jgi:hypothetical protein